MLGSRAIYHGGWKAVTFHALGPLYGDGLDHNAPFDEDVWELYHVAEDLSETKDLALEHPEKLTEMVDLWWSEARRNQVLPLDNRVLWAVVHPKPDRRRPRTSYRYFPGGAQVPETVAVNVRNRSHAITVGLAIRDAVVPNGILLALGSVLGGWSLHLLDGRLRYVHNLYGKERHVIDAPELIGPGNHVVGFEFEKLDGPGGAGRLSIDGRISAEAPISRFTPGGFNGVGVGLTCGTNGGRPSVRVTRLRLHSTGRSRAPSWR